MENKIKKLLPKSKGKSIMISGFVCPCHGFISATIDDQAIHSCQLFYAGTSRRWFTNEDLVKQIQHCKSLFIHFHPKCEILLAFDNFMTHRAKAPNALDALCSNQNLSDGGKNCMPIRDGWFINTEGQRIVQKMQYDSGIQKGIKQILLERNLFTNAEGKYGLLFQCKKCGDKTPRNQRPVNNDRCCARYVLSQQPDFQEQDPWLVEVCKSCNFSIIFYPKYHCELNFIEIIWG